MTSDATTPHDRAYLLHSLIVTTGRIARVNFHNGEFFVESPNPRNGHWVRI